MTEQHEEVLRSAARTWLDAADRLEHAMGDPNSAIEAMDAADAATIARMRFHQTLVELGWTPPASVSNNSE